VLGFLSAQVLGERVLRPFLQDTIQFWPLTAAMAGTLLVTPITIARVLLQVPILSCL
jgi:lycopene cyclase CruP